MALDITVSDLLNHKSGLGDVDVDSRYEVDILQHHAHAKHSPLLDLRVVANFSAPSYCTTGNCTWIFRPGTACSYSSTNFLVVGLVLLAHAPHGQDTWDTFDLRTMLGFKHGDYAHTFFPVVGPINKRGLDAVGDCRHYGQPTDIYRQDASIMGWMYGNAVVSAKDIARFYWYALNPANAGVIISATSLAAMVDWHKTNYGWRANSSEEFGAGLERIYASQVPLYQNLTACYGHAGSTYGVNHTNGNIAPRLSKRRLNVLIWDAFFTHYCTARCRAKKHVSNPE